MKITRKASLALLCRDGFKLDLVRCDGWTPSENNVGVVPVNAVFKTHAWKMNVDKAVGLVGKRVVLCQSTTDKSYVGGTITGVEVESDGRVGITFQSREDCVGYTVTDWISQNPVKYL